MSETFYTEADQYGQAVTDEFGDTTAWEWPAAGLIMTTEDMSHPVFTREGTPARVTLNADHFAAGMVLSMGPDAVFSVVMGLFDEIDAHILAHGDAREAVACLTEGADPDGPIAAEFVPGAEWPEE